jgi:hypothetical protein
MLAATAAVGLPVLIHYLTRARPRRIAFPPYRFLAEACAGQQAVHRLRTWLLLALRCLAVLALAFAFAQPFLKPRGAAGAANASKRVVLILDASLSMRAVQRGTPLFTKAQAEAADVLRALESGTEAGVILAGASPRALLPALSKNIPALHDVLVRSQATYESADMAAAFALATKMAGGTGTIYVFSDFQKSNWENAGTLPGELICRLRPVTTIPVDNMGLIAARLSPAEPVAGETAEAICTVFNSTARPRKESVRLELGDFVQEKQVTVPAFGTGDAVFQVAFPKEGFFSGKAAMQPDDLREDNTRYIDVRVRKSLQVLLVSDADASDRRSAAFFIQRALAPSPEAAPGLNIVRRHSQDTDRGILETADIFLLASPATLSGEAAQIIERRVQDGARCIAFLDGPTSPFLVPASFSPPFQLQRPVASEAGDTLVPGARKIFAEAEAADWSSLRFRRHYLNQVLENRKSDVLFSYADGSAALTFSAVGKGSAVFANLPLTPDGGDFIGHPLFPAVLQELLRSLRRGNEQAGGVKPGEVWTLETASSGDAAVEVTDPEGKRLTTQTLSSGRTTRLAMPAARLPGLYLVKQGGQNTGAGVVNVDARETDTRQIALENLKTSQGGAMSVVRQEEDLLVEGKSRPLWPQLAMAALIFFALEMLLLAWWRPAFARRVQPPVSSVRSEPLQHEVAR